MPKRMPIRIEILSHVESIPSIHRAMDQILKEAPRCKKRVSSLRIDYS